MSILKSASHFHGSSPGDLGWSRPSGWEHGDSLQVDHGVFKTLRLRTQGLPAGGPWQGTVAGQPGLASDLSQASVSSLGKYEKSVCLAGYGEGVRELMKGSKGSQ